MREYKVRNFYTVKEVDEDFINTHQRAEKNGMKVIIFRNIVDDGSKWYFSPVWLGLWWLEEIEYNK